MTLQQLRYAIAVADCGSMNQAAAKLFISQPSLSEAVKEPYIRTNKQRHPCDNGGK